jgi:uncharacterized protein
MLRTKTLVIDADAHVLESERTWDYLEPSDRKYRPVPVTVPDDPSIGRARRDAWVIDGKIRGLRFPTLTQEELGALSAKLGRDVRTQQASREMGDVDLRLRHMDALGIDVQVLHNTVFIESVSDRPEVEVALCRAWNRWMAEVWQLGQGRLRWVCVPPFQSIPHAIDEIRFGKAHGAVGIQLPPFAGSRLMTDPYFYPLFGEAERLDLPIASHIANANPWMVDLFRAMYPGNSAVGAAFPVFLVPSVIGTQALLISPIGELFPRLRWGIIEANAQWIPYVLNDVKERFLRRGEATPQSILTAKNVYVACQNRDDVPYIIDRAGDDCLLLGTDYGHTDTSSDVDAIALFQRRTDISALSKQKIISDNPRRFYGL